MLYLFGDWTLDTDRRQLCLQGVPTRVEPKVFDLLGHLLAQSPRVVTKEELFTAVWPEQYASESALSYSIAEARKALGDSGRSQKFIKTIHGRGYSFIAPVVVQETAQQAADKGAAPAHDDASPSLPAFQTTESEGAREPELVPVHTPELLPEATPALDPSVTPSSASAILPTSSHVPQSLPRGRATSQGSHPMRVPEAERRQITVLWCRTTLRAVHTVRLDPEDIHHVLQDVYAVCEAICQPWEGRIAQPFGDGFAVYFGHPQAHEDDAQRAVHTGLEMVQRLHALQDTWRQRHSVTLTVHVGIHTGPVVVGAVDAPSFLTFGDTQQRAAHVAGLAAPGAVVISSETLPLVEGYFRCCALAPCSAENPIPALSGYQVLEACHGQTRLGAARGRGMTPFAGREHELGLLSERWEQAREGQGQVVVLSGESGVGKSRLVQVVQERMAADAALLIECQCAPHTQHSALHPLLAQIPHWLQWQENDPTEVKLHTLESMLTTVGYDVATGMPVMTALLSLQPVTQDPPLDLALHHHQKMVVFDILRTWLLYEAERRPVCVVIEDLHWLDASTMEFLDGLLEQVSMVRMFILLTCRPEFAPSWTVRSHVMHLALNRLTQSQTARMITAMTGGKALAEEVVQYLMARTHGVPLFVEEMTKMVLESGLVKERDDVYVLTEPLPVLTIPATLQDALTARLDQQGRGKLVAQVGATIGRDFSYSLLQAIVPLDEGELRQGLSQLVSAEILHQQGFPPQASYRFKHALLQEAAYQSLLRTTRQQYHAYIVRAIESHFPELQATQPALLASHCMEAGLHEPAMRYWRKAGEHALEHLAYLEASEYLTRSLEQLALLPATPELLSHELALHMALGTAWMAIRGQTSPEVHQAYARAHALCHHMPDSPQLFRVLLGLWRFYGARAELATAKKLADQLMLTALRMQDRDLMLEAHMALGNSLLFSGDFVGARLHLTQGLALYNVQSHRAHTVLYGRDPGVVCASINALALWKLGYPDQAVHMSRQAMALAEELGHTVNRVFALCQASLLHHFRREPHETLRLVDAVFSLAAEDELGPWILGQVTVLRGWALVMHAQEVEGLEQLHKGLYILRDIDTELPWPLFQYVDAYRHLGRAEEGLQILAESSDVYWRHGQTLLQQATEERVVWAEIPALFWLRGELCLQQQSPDVQQALASWQQALALARHQEARSDELRIALSLSRVFEARGNRHEAYQVLAEAYHWFTEGAETPLLCEAQAFLATLT